MTHNILPTDIELAKKLLAAKRPDTVVATALVQRGIDPAVAAQVVDNLRDGREVTPQIPAGLEISPRHRSRSKRMPDPIGSPAPASIPEASVHREPRVRRGSKSRKRLPWLGIILAILVCVAAVVIGVVISNRSRSGADEAQSKKPQAATSSRNAVPSAEPNSKPPRADVTAPAIPAGSSITNAGRPAVKEGAPGSLNDPKRLATPLPKATVPSKQPVSHEVVLNLQLDGLRIDGSLVVRGDTPACVSKVLGRPTRSIPGEQPGTMVYAYDEHGLLIYITKESGKESIVLDCDANGGVNGTTSPFTGSIQIESQVIRPGTDSKTLAAIQSLGLRNPGTVGGIWGGHYHGLDLAFAYLKTPQRLSLIEIDFK